MNPRDMIADLETVPDASVPDTGTPDLAPEAQLADGAGAGAADVDTTVETNTGDTAALDALDQIGQPDRDPLEQEATLARLQAENEQTRQLLASLLGMGDDQQTPPEFDLNPFEDNFGQQLMQVLAYQQQQTMSAIQTLAQQVTAPLEQQRQQETLAQGEQNLQDMLADDIARNGEFASNPEVDKKARTMARTRADQIYMELAGRYGGHEFVLQSGMGPRVSEAAMSQAAQEIRDLLKAAGQQAVTQHANHTATLAGAHSEPGGLTGAVAGTPQFNSPSEATAYYASRARSLTSAA